MKLYATNAHDIRIELLKKNIKYLEELLERKDLELDNRSRSYRQEREAVYELMEFIDNMRCELDDELHDGE